MSVAARPIIAPAATPARSSAGRTPRSVWAGRVLSALPVAFLLFDGALKLVRVPEVAQGMVQSGWPVHLAATLGVILLACTILYLIPRTAVLGAILLTGYLGGAVATHLRLGNPLASYILFPVYIGVMLWGGLYLRDARVRALIPFRGTAA